jgi:hypothetical protein
MTRYSGQDSDEQKRQVQPTSYPVCLAVIILSLSGYVRVTLTEMLTDFDFQTLVNTSEDPVPKSVIVRTKEQDQHSARACDRLSIAFQQPGIFGRNTGGQRDLRDEN